MDQASTTNHPIEAAFSLLHLLLYSTFPASMSTVQPGDIVGHFEVMRLIGQGGNGEVFVARDQVLGRKVALKVVSSRRLTDEHMRDSFLEEAKSTARFSHPNIVTVFEVGVHDQKPYIAYEFINGQTLRERILEEAPSAKQAMRFASSMCEAVAEAHEQEVLHCDLKPDNMMVGRDGRLRVLDFGLAQLARQAKRVQQVSSGGFDSDLTPSTSPGEDIAAAGTPHYMAPELFAATPNSAASDVWALGITLYELFVGKMPFDNNEPIFQILTADPVPLNDKFDERTRTLVGACLNKDPSKRPTARELHQHFEAQANGSERVLGEENPFRGLMSFEEAHARDFFGRDDEIAELIELLRQRPVLPLIGASGAGKSSLVRAGVFTRLKDQAAYEIVWFRPGAQPLASLAAALSQETADFGKKLQDDHTYLAKLLRQRATDSRCHVLLFVDQLEEVVTLNQDNASQDLFLSALAQAADDHQDPVRVIFTLRDDFVGRIASTEAMRMALRSAVVLRAPSASSLKETIAGPLRLRGYTVDDPTLLDEMVSAVDAGNGLPLLQFTARMLWDTRDRTKRRINRADYLALGGAAGALATHADAVLAGLNEASLGLVREVFLRMVTENRTRRLLDEAELNRDLGEEAVQLIGRFVDARLVVRRRNDNGSHYEIAHETLIQSWQTLRRWLDESRDDIAFVRELEQAARLWAQRGKHDAELWQGKALQEAEYRASRTTTKPSGDGLQFLDMSRQLWRKQQRARTRRQVAIGFMLTVLIVGSWLVALAFKDQQQHATVQRDAARNALGDSLMQSVRVALSQDDTLTARANSRAALELGDSLERRSLWFAASATSLVWQKNFALEIVDAVLCESNDQAFSLVLVGNGALRMVNSHTGEQRILGSHDAWPHSISVSADCTTAISVDQAGRMATWNLPAGDATWSNLGALPRRVILTADGSMALLQRASDTLVFPPNPMDQNKSWLVI